MRNLTSNIWMMIDSLWDKNETSRLSPNTSVILQPSIYKNSYAPSFIVPRISTLIGRNSYAVEGSEYFWHFPVAAISAT